MRRHVRECLSETCTSACNIIGTSIVLSSLAHCFAFVASHLFHTFEQGINLNVKKIINYNLQNLWFLHLHLQLKFEFAIAIDRGQLLLQCINAAHEIDTYP